MAEIVLLTLVFPPDNVSTAHYMGEYAEAFAKTHNVTVVTTIPHFNEDKEISQNIDYTSHWGGLYRRTHLKDSDVFQCYIPQKDNNIPKRIFGWVLFHIVSTLIIILKVKKVDIIITPSPPLTIGLVAWATSKIRQCNFIYNVQEVYPDCAIALGALQNKYAIRLLFKIESLIYQNAKLITVISKNIQENLLFKGVDQNKLAYIPNYADIEDFPLLPKQNPFSEEHNLHNKFLVTYAGNFGKPQSLDTLIDAAILCEDIHDIHFLLVGDGMMRKQLIQYAEKKQLQNLTILEYQPYSLVPQIYASTDLGFVPQASEIADTAIPSKVYRLMASRCPILATTTHNSELSNIISEYDCGFRATPNSAISVANIVKEAYNNAERLNKMKQNGRNAVVNNFSKSENVKKYLEIIEKHSVS